MKTTVYNKNNDKIDIEITDYDGEFEVVSCQIQTNDISQEIFTGILGTELKLNILTADNNLYTGSLIGKSINITLNTSNELHYTIISNVASMPANYIQEEIEICAVDDLTMLKNKRYEKKSYLTLKEILSDILSTYIILDGWGGTETLLNLIFNTATLYTDEGHTPPTQYEVIEALMKYVNRSLMYDSSKRVYILFNPNVLKKEKTVTKGVKVSKNGNTQTVNEIIPVNYITRTTVAQSDKTVTLLDPWASAQVTSSFDDIKTQVAKGQYKETEDVGVKTIGNKEVMYSAYFGDAAGNHYAPSIGSLDNLTIKNIETAVKNGEYGGCLVNLATADAKDGKAEGTRTGDEYIMLYGCKNTTTQDEAVYLSALTPLYEYVINTNVLTTGVVVAIIQDTVIYSDYPFPFESGKFECNNPNVIFQYAYNTDAYNDNYVISARLDFPNNSETQYKGQSMTTINDITWASRLKNKGVHFYLEQKDKGNIPLNTLRFRLFPNLWSKIYHDEYSTKKTKNTARPSQFEFHKLKISIESLGNVEEDLFETDSVIKAINDYSHGITINGNQLEEKPKFVTSGGVKSYTNCAYLYMGEINETPFIQCAGGMVDDEKYYNREICTSEERFVADIDAHYFRNLFSEKVTLRGIKPFFSIYKESFFDKKMMLTSATINITEGTTTVSLQEI